MHLILYWTLSYRLSGSATRSIRKLVTSNISFVNQLRRPVSCEQINSSAGARCSYIEEDERRSRFKTQMSFYESK